MDPFYYGLIAFVVIFIGYSYFNYRRMKHFASLQDAEEIQHLTTDNFKAKTAKGVVLVDFWAGWCPPCKMMAPVLNQVARASGGVGQVAKVNVEEQQRLAEQFKVRSIPTDRKSTRLNSSHVRISYAVVCLKKKNAPSA